MSPADHSFLHYIISCMCICGNCYYFPYHNSAYTKEQVIVQPWCYCPVPLTPTILINGNKFRPLYHIHHTKSYEYIFKKVGGFFHEYDCPEFFRLFHPRFLLHNYWYTLSPYAKLVTPYCCNIQSSFLKFNESIIFCWHILITQIQLIVVKFRFIL